MENHWIFKIIVFAFMASIVFALGSGLYFLLSGKETKQTVKALTTRITLSLVLFVLLMIAFAIGWIKPHGILIPISNKQTQTETAIPHRQNANTTPPLQKQNDVQQ